MKSLVAVILFLCPGPAWAVGVNYVATGTDHASTAFLTRYHEPAIRSLVRQQLAEMAATGTTEIRTTLWFVDAGQGVSEPWRHHFPPTYQELLNLLTYTRDVQAAGLDLDLAFGWLGCAEYSQADPPCGQTWEQLWATMDLTIDWVGYYFWQAQVHPRALYLDVETTMARPRMDQFLLRGWWRLQNWSAGIGSIARLYFASPEAAQTALLWLRANGQHIPDRIDFSLYPMGMRGAQVVPQRPYGPEITQRLRALTDEANLGIAETLYPLNAQERLELGAALRADPRVTSVMIWPTAPDPHYAGSPPFDLSAYDAH